MSTRARVTGALLGLCLTCCLLPLAADERVTVSDTALERGEQRLRAWLDDTDTLRARFEQSLLDVNGELMQTSAGELMIRRPGRFRWEYQTPYEQLIVADGERLWLYEPDLAQVTVRAQDASLDATPASLLSGEEDFTAHYRVTLSERNADGLEVVRLEPRAAGGDFRYLAIGFTADGELKRMELMDRLDQLTRIEFDDVRRGVRLRSGLFSFRPPADVDVIESGAPAQLPDENGGGAGGSTRDVP